MKTTKMFFISVGPNKEWAEKNARQISREATAFALRRQGKTLEFTTKEDADDYCRMFNGSLNQTKHAVVVPVPVR